jgi:hypothetical protein
MTIMKLTTALSALAIASTVPVAAQASVASHEAMQANHEPLQRQEVSTPQSQQNPQGFIEQRFAGASDAIAHHARAIEDRTQHGTDIQDASEHIGTQKPQVGHASDW